MDLKKQSLIDQAIDDLGGKWIGDAQKFNTLAKAGGVYFTDHSRSAPIPSICTYTEYESRKAERQNKPDWGKASDWAQWLAQDSSGKWWWYPNYMSAPTLASQCFINGSIDPVISAGAGEVIGDWRDTLEQRPSHIGESADRYDYDRLIATGYPKPSEIVQAFYGQNDGTGRWVECFVTGLSEHGDLVLETRGSPPGFDKWFTVDCKSKYRPLDFNKVAKHPWHEQGSETSPELSFHLSTAFNELQASARLLPEDDPRKQMLVSLANGVSVVLEGV